MGSDAGSDGGQPGDPQRGEPPDSSWSSRLEVVINRKTAKALGLTVLARADEVIQ
jgi:hypothetical protein